MTNTDRISEIRARCEAATPGPWEWRCSDNNPYSIEAEALTNVIYLEDDYPGYPECGEHLFMNIETSDAEFISHAREDIPFLLSQLAERDKELKRLQKEVASLAIESIEREKTLAKLEAEVMQLWEAQRCGDCKHRGKYETERECGYPSPCTLCVRRAPDNFEPLPAAPEEGESK